MSNINDNELLKLIKKLNEKSTTDEIEKVLKFDFKRFANENSEVQEIIKCINLPNFESKYKTTIDYIIEKNSNLKPLDLSFVDYKDNENTAEAIKNFLRYRSVGCIIELYNKQVDDEEKVFFDDCDSSDPSKSIHFELLGENGIKITEESGKYFIPINTNEREVEEEKVELRFDTMNSFWSIYKYALKNSDVEYDKHQGFLEYIGKDNYNKWCNDEFFALCRYQWLLSEETFNSIYEKINKDENLRELARLTHTLGNFMAIPFIKDKSLNQNQSLNLAKGNSTFGDFIDLFFCYLYDDKDENLYYFKNNDKIEITQQTKEKWKNWVDNSINGEKDYLFIENSYFEKGIQGKLEPLLFCSHRRFKAMPPIEKLSECVKTMNNCIKKRNMELMKSLNPKLANNRDFKDLYNDLK